jgi:hypothetical protein
MVPRRPGPGELLAGASGALLLVAMFLPWFGLDGRVRVPGTGQVISVGRDPLNAWEAFGAIDVVLAVVAVLAMAVLVVGLVRSPPPALVAAAAGGAAAGALLIVYRLIDVPDIPIGDAGDTAYESGRKLGAFFGLLCTAGIAWGAGVIGAGAEAEERPEPAAPEPAAPAAPTLLPQREPEPLPPEPEPEPAPSLLVAWPRAAVDAEAQAPWRRYDRRLGTRYARYFAERPELAGEQRTSARDLVAALPPGWEAPADAIPDRPWERRHLAAKSSEMLGLGLLGVAATRDPSLAWLWDALEPLPPAADDTPSLRFGHVVDPSLLGERPRQTGLDVLVDDPNVLIGLSIKWREHGVGGCLCRGDGVGPLAGDRCSRRVEQRRPYWEAAADLFGLPGRGPDAPCPISPVYETVRQAAALRALAGPDRPAVLALLYDAANPYFARTGEWPGWPALLDQAVAGADPQRFRFVSVSWQELVPALPLDAEARAWAADKHGLGRRSVREAQDDVQRPARAGPVLGEQMGPRAVQQDADGDDDQDGVVQLPGDRDEVRHEVDRRGQVDDHGDE